MRNEEVVIRGLGRVGYLPTFESMRAFTAARGPATPDELWVLEHSPVDRKSVV